MFNRTLFSILAEVPALPVEIKNRIKNLTLWAPKKNVNHFGPSVQPAVANIHKYFLDEGRALL